MPRLNRIAVEHYRAFEHGLSIDLRPLTLVYGKNNAGKSSIVRLLGILHDSLAESADAPLELQGEAGGGAAFINILNARDQELKRLRLGLSWDDGFSATWGIGLHQVDRMERLQVEELIVTAEGAQGQPRPACWYGNPRVPEAIPPDEGERITSLTFRGLMPQDATPLPPLMASLRSRLLDIRGHVQYLSAVRAKPSYLVEERGVQPSLSASGAETQEILLYDRLALTEVETWLRREVHRDLRRQPMAPKTWQWVLPPASASELAIPLASTGEGMAQLLPILLALGQRRSVARADGKTYLAMEEPTTHLHDDLQIQLAQHLAEIAGEAEPPVVLLETHARPLLLGVQLAIQKGLDPSRVILYWVEQDERGASRADAVEFDRDGLPTSRRLRRTFSDERRILRELSRAHLHAGPAASDEGAPGSTPEPRPR
ncbi:AAA family ATPase [Sorangium sp. So ce269]